MIISDKHKLLIIHIPRTGGTLFRKLVKENDDKYHEVDKVCSPATSCNIQKYKEYKKFVLARNIYDRMASYYRFDCHIKQNKAFKNITFTEWFDIRKKDLLFLDQTLYFTIDNEIIVDEILIYKDIRMNLGLLCFDYKWNHTFEIEEKTYSKERFLNNENINLIDEHCQNEIKFFDWKR